MDVRDVPVVKWSDSLTLESFVAPDFMSEPFNQGECGACWAVASASCAADRIRTTLVPAATQDVTKNSQDCVSYGISQGCNSACEGGYMVTGLFYIRRVGMLKYNGIRVKCGPVFRLNLFDTFGVTNQSYIQRTQLTSFELKQNANNIAREVQQRGTVCATFNMFSNFSDFWQKEDESTVYTLSYPDLPNLHKTEGSKSWTKDSMFRGPQNQYFITAHSIIIIGFGTTEDGHDYWLCRNSWGASKMRSQGLFRISRGVNMCGIESDVLACLPRETDVLIDTDSDLWSITYNTSLLSPSTRRIFIVVFILIMVLVAARLASKTYRFKH
jgi:Papain family cysteine protease